MTEIERINKELIASYGKSPTGRPFWRLVWSEKQFEYRHGTFNEFYNEIFLRSEIGTKLRRKYNYVKERWILERYVGAEAFQRRPETPMASLEGSYEPIYVFQDKNGNYLAPNRKVVDFLVKMAERPQSKASEQDIIDELKRREALEVQEFADALGE